MENKLDEKRWFNGNSYYGRYVEIPSDEGKTEQVLMFDSALYEQTAPFINGGKEIRDSDDREAIFFDDEIYAYVPREILQKDDKEVLAWCKDNGVDIGNVEERENKTVENTMDMQEVIAQIKWTVQDVHDAFVNNFKREPSGNELKAFVDRLDTETMEERGIEVGWTVVDSLMLEEGKEIIRNVGDEENREIRKKFQSDFDVSENEIANLIDEIKDGNPEINDKELNEEIAFRLIEKSVDMHGFESMLGGKAVFDYEENPDGKAEIDNVTNSRIMQIHDIIIEEAANKYVHDEIKFNAIQDYIDKQLKLHDLYRGFEKTGVLTDFIERDAVLEQTGNRMRVLSYEPFGNDGNLVNVEVDLRRGIPAVDIVGLSDGYVKESRERIRAAIKNSGLGFPSERLLVSLSPADLKKEGTRHNLAVATAIICAQKNIQGESALAIGELDLSGHILPAREVLSAVEEAAKNGVRNIICCPTDASKMRGVEGINVLIAENLSQLDVQLTGIRPFEKLGIMDSVQMAKENTRIEFSSQKIMNIGENYLKGFSKQCEAIEAAVAGKHNLLLEGKPGCGKMLLAEDLVPYLTPKMTYDEAHTTERIHEIAGIGKNRLVLCEPAPIRMPHPTASLEGMCGGGTTPRPGEVSLAHNGVLIMDEAAEFKSSVIQMVAAPLKHKSISVSRAGRSTVFPAKFQLVMAANPCACGNSGSPGHLCLCSNRSLDLYKKKLEPLSNLCEVKTFVLKDPTDKKIVSLEKMRERIATAYKIQRERGTYNAHLSPEQLKSLIDFTPEMNEYIAQNFSAKTNDWKRERDIINAMRLSLTVANMDGRTQVTIKDLKKAIDLGQDIEVQAKKICQKIEKAQDKKQLREGR